MQATEDLILGWFPNGRAFADRWIKCQATSRSVNVVQARDPGTTGNFEITVNGKLVHSKKTQNHGFFESAPKAQCYAECR
ncbi:unnamed protein product [Effrenium voratum]|nr:unnamed protein product [Effrenium voratum]